MMLDSGIQKILNSIPVPVFLVDQDVVILLANKAALALVTENRQILGVRGGEALNCLHATENPGGCGHAVACKDCIIRKSVQSAFDDEAVVQQMHMLELVTSEEDSKLIKALISATPYAINGKRLAVLTVENVTELLHLREIIPICANCKKVRNDANYWEAVDEYVARNLDVQLSHGICPDCLSRLYGRVMQNGPSSQ